MGVCGGGESKKCLSMYPFGCVCVCARKEKNTVLQTVRAREQ